LRETRVGGAEGVPPPACLEPPMERRLVQAFP